jgi:methylase of polypeptide subunit release factors
MEVNMNQIMEDERNEFQDTIWRDMESRKNICHYDIGELVDYPIFPKVFNPVVAKASLFFLENLGARNQTKVLDMFTGSGVYAIKSISEGSNSVVAVDNYLQAYKNAKFAVKNYNLEDKIDVRLSNLFEKVELNEKFNLILTNPPFRSDANPRTRSEKALRDKDYETLENFWKEVHSYIAPIDSSVIRMVFSDVGDMAYNEQLMKQNGFDFKIVAKTMYASSIRIHVYEAKPK